MYCSNKHPVRNFHSITLTRNGRMLVGMMYHDQLHPPRGTITPGVPVKPFTWASANCRQKRRRRTLSVGRLEAA